MSYNPSSFDEDAYLLSIIKDNRDNIPNIPPKGQPIDQYHLSLLDDIAILLTTKAKGDVTAVTWRLTQNRAEILFSKNAPTRKVLDPYLSEVTHILASSAPRYEREVKLLNLALKTCINKVRYRIEKVQKSLPNPRNNLQHSFQTPEHYLSATRSGIT